MWILVFVGLSAFAEETYHITKQKNTKINTILPQYSAEASNTIQVDGKFFESQNAFTAMDGFKVMPSVESTVAGMDLGGHGGLSLGQMPFLYTSFAIDGVFVPDQFIDKNEIMSTNNIQKATILKGSASSGVFPSAMAGVVDITTNPVEKDDRFADVQIGGYGTRFIRAGMQKKTNSGGFFATVNMNQQNAVDGNKDGIAESPYARRTFATIGGNIKSDSGFNTKLRLDLTKSLKLGGAYALGGSLGDLQSNTSGNPFNFSADGSPVSNGWIAPDGSTQTWDSGAAGILEVINTSRAAFTSSSVKEDDKSKTHFGSMISSLGRNNYYSGAKYEARDQNLYLTASHKIKEQMREIEFGTSFQHSAISSNILSGGTSYTNADSYNYNVPGVFGSYNIKQKGGMIQHIVSGRLDYETSTFGAIPTLRYAGALHHTHNVISKAGFGTGYNLPSTSFESNDVLIAAGVASLNRHVNKPEQNNNAFYNISYSNDDFQAIASYNYNKISNMAVLELDSSNNATFTNFKDDYTIQGVDLYLLKSINERLSVSFGGEKYWHDFTALKNQGAYIPAKLTEKIYTSLTFDNKTDKGIISITYYAPQDLSTFYPTMYGLDGNALPRYTKGFFSIDGRAEHRIHKNFSVYGGVSNLLNYVQVRTSSQLTGSTDEIEPTYIWGPTRGRYFYAGFKYAM